MNASRSQALGELTPIRATAVLVLPSHLTQQPDRAVAAVSREAS
jgi:hypothetical protein